MFPILDENPAHDTPWATYGLMGLLSAVFFVQLLSGEGAVRAIYSFGFIPAVFFGHMRLPASLDTLPAPATLLTYHLLHGSLLHLAGNLLYLWVFGNNVEEALGRLRYIFFYLICGASAALIQAVMDGASQVPIIGASGAVSAVLGAYLLLYPRAQILVVIPLGFILYPAKLSAYWVLGVWFLLQLASAFLTHPDEPGIAWWAHFGGFLSGALLVCVLHRRDHPLFRDVRVIPKGPLARRLVEPPDRAR